MNRTSARFNFKKQQKWKYKVLVGQKISIYLLFIYFYVLFCFFAFFPQISPQFSRAN